MAGRAFIAVGICLHHQEKCSWGYDLCSVSHANECQHPDSPGASLQQQGATRSAPQSSEGDRTATVIDRTPLREIRNEYPTYSAVAVDPVRDEIVLQDENFFGIMVFDRTTNTPPTARMSAPKRMIRGPKANIQFNCGVYVDHNMGDIYSLSNDVQDAMVVFPGGAKGDAAPARDTRQPNGYRTSRWIGGAPETKLLGNNFRTGT